MKERKRKRETKNGERMNGTRLAEWAFRLCRPIYLSGEGGGHGQNRKYDENERLCAENELGMNAAPM